MIKKIKVFTLLVILIVGFFLRILDINWDQNTHLHPDERFLTLVDLSMKVPKPIQSYFNPTISPFNPSNIGYNFYVYGISPIVLNKLLATIFNNDTYNGLTIQGRTLSALADFFVIILVFKITELLEHEYKIDKNIKYFSSFLYAIAVLPIQLSHFFAVDTFLNFFSFLSFYFALRLFVTRKISYLILSAIFLGAAFSAKITAIFIAPLDSFFLLAAIPRLSLYKNTNFYIRATVFFLLFLLCSYFALRIFDPYYFASPNPFIFKPNDQFVQSLKTLEQFSTSSAWYPPAVQWIHKTPFLFSFKNLVLFGIGIPYFIAFLIGSFVILKKMKKTLLSIILSWIILFFTYQSVQFAATMRYFILIYPFIAVIAGIGIGAIFQILNNRYFRFLVFITIILWPLLFLSIYTKPHTRIAASNWIYQNISSNSTILGEHWDDMLPLPIQNNKQFNLIELPVFGPDTAEKWDEMNKDLQQGNYLILSSNRGWGSIPTVPERYPKMTQFYKDLFAGKLAYKKIKEFDSFPSLRYLGIPVDIPDSGAEEAFTVYDHPRVMIFKRM